VWEGSGGADGEAAPDRETGGDRETLPLDELGDEIARLAGHRHAATARFLRLVAAFDRRRGWEAGGHRSCAHWLVVRTGCSLRTARGHVRTARALEELPETSGAMGRGALSYCQARALTRVATPETETDLLRLAEGCTTSTLERRVRAWRKGGPRDEVAREEELHRSRRLTVACDGDGGYVIRGRLEPEVGAVLLRALEAAADALYRERHEGDGRAGGSYEPGSGGRLSPRQGQREACRRRADAMGLVAERALAAGFGGGEGGEDGQGGDVPVSGTRAERYQAFLHVDLGTLAEVDLDADGGAPADPGPLTASARWQRERSVPDEVWFRAHEAALVAAEESRRDAGDPG